MFTHVVGSTSDESKDVSMRMRGAEEVLGLVLDDYGSPEEDDVFVWMMLRGVIAVAFILLSVRRFDVVA